MRNRILSITRNVIPYVKELHPLTGSVIGCLVMQQLDYWFSSQPEGFYKFLEPAEHPAYKAGDSWVEELGMSADEFRYAFDRISIRYKSRTEFEKASKTGDIFKGKFYCSYIDRRANLTYYYRNHDVVDAALDQLIHEASANKNQKSKGKRVAPQTGASVPINDAPKSVSACSESNISVTGNSDLQSWKSRSTELEIPISANGLFPGPFIQRLRTETTTTTTTTTTDAPSLSTEPPENADPGDLPQRGGCDDSGNKKSKPENTELIWPICSPEERDALADILKTVSPSQRQIILDETEGASRAGSIRTGVVPFAHALVRAMLAGTFTPSYSPAVAAHRRELATKMATAAIARIPPSISGEDLARGQAVLAKFSPKLTQSSQKTELRGER